MNHEAPPSAPDRASKVTREVLDTLVSAKVITEAAATLVTGYMARWQCDVLDALLETHTVESAQLARTLAQRANLPLVRIGGDFVIPPDSFEILPFAQARGEATLALQNPAGQRYLIVANPALPERFSPLLQALGPGFALSVGERRDIVRAIDELYPLLAQLPSLHDL